MMQNLSKGKVVRKQILRFLLVGGMTVGIDSGTYLAILGLGAGVVLSKAVGYIMGTLFAFFANRAWTFGACRGGIRQFILFGTVYTINLAINVGVNSGLLMILGVAPIWIAVAFVSATGCSATLNFIGMRFVFVHLSA